MKIPLTLRYDLPFVEIEVEHKNQKIIVPSILVDTGSATTIISTDILSTIRIYPEPTDEIRTIRGVGGKEVVYRKRIDKIRIGGIIINDFIIEVGEMDYGFEIYGILGINLLRAAHCIINLREITLEVPAY